MNILKKLAFAPLFLLSFVLLIYQITPFLSSYDFIFSLSLNNVIQLLTIAALFSVSCLLFSVFVTLAADWKIVLPVSFLSALVLILFLDPALAIVFAVAVFISFLLIFLSLETTLKSYLTFRPEALLGPSIRRLASLLVLAFCLIFFLSTNKIIAQKGFQIPDSLIDTALKMTPLESPTEEGTQVARLPDIAPEQLELLKKNPELLRQSGLDPKILDTLNQPKNSKTPQNLAQELVKQTVKDQIQGFIKPYINFIPAGLALLLFLTLQSLTSIINLLIYPLLWFTFFILEKTGFVKFEVEQRPVKKLIV
ncbi:MAG: hypothetical protein NUV73_00970 [Candidatus Daviesbacteria bacterium]|nr:hypothetical protein [Candidatus Daviesbacteria bacterium]